MRLTAESASIHEPRSWTQNFQDHWRRVVQPLAPLAEKKSLTNRIRGHFARIKAIGPTRYRLWIPTEIRSPEPYRSGHVRTVGRGNHGAHHANSRFHMDASWPTCGLRFDHLPGATI